jgi:2-dehydro-3-deoxyphosphogluconate aldolase / (4S)-4-hydroxy-2-oxoglutarate aldolase
MDKQTLLSKIQEIRIIAVIRGPSADLTVRIVEALVNGGITGIEITYSTPQAEEVVKTMDRQYGEDIVLGMGTLTAPQQTQAAKKAGARFLVSPICDPDLTRAMLASGLVTMVGALTPTEVELAYRLGADVVKIFPGSLVGPAYIKAIKGPFPQIPFMPTGGVSLENIGDWFAAGVVAVGVGSELCPPQFVKEGRFAEITQRAQEFRAAIENSRPKR